MPAETQDNHKEVTTDQISMAQAQLKAERRLGDPLRIELAEAALNDLLDRYSCHTYHMSPQESR